MLKEKVVGVIKEIRDNRIIIIKCHDKGQEKSEQAGRSGIGNEGSTGHKIRVESS